MGLTAYTLPDIVYLQGTYHLTLYASDELSLTVPTNQTVIEIGAVKERGDILAGVTEVENCEIIIADDHTNHAAGFWFTAMGGIEAPQLKIILHEPTNGDVYYFWGIVDLASTEFIDNYLVSTTYVRACRLTLLSMLTKMKTASVVDMLTDLVSKQTVYDPLGAVTNTAAVLVGGSGLGTDWDYEYHISPAIGEYTGVGDTADVILASIDPNNLSATDYHDITWDAATGATKYVIYRRIRYPSGVGGVWGSWEIITATATGTSYHDTSSTTITAVDTTPLQRKTLPFYYILAACCKQALGDLFFFSPDVDGVNVELINGDLKYRAGGTDYDFMYLMLQMTDQYGTITAPDVKLTDYFNGSSDKWWGDRYENCFDIVSSICLSFGIVPRMRFDISAGAFYLQLMSRGRNYAGYITFSKETKTSSFNMLSVTIPKAIRTFDRWTPASYYSTATEITEATVFDVDIPCEFNTDDSAPVYERLKVNNSSVPTVITSVKYYNYSSSSWTEVSTGGVLIFLNAVCEYYRNRWMIAKKKYMRQYGSIFASNGSTLSTAHIHWGRRMQISSDGGAAKAYYANEVEKNAMDNTTTIQWIEE